MLKIDRCNGTVYCSLWKPFSPLNDEKSCDTQHHSSFLSFECFDRKQFQIRRTPNINRKYKNNIVLFGGCIFFSSVFQFSSNNDFSYPVTKSMVLFPLLRLLCNVHLENVKTIVYSLSDIGWLNCTLAFCATKHEVL